MSSELCSCGYVPAFKVRIKDQKPKCPKCGKLTEPVSERPVPAAPEPVPLSQMQTAPVAAPPPPPAAAPQPEPARVTIDVIDVPREPRPSFKVQPIHGAMLGGCILLAGLFVFTRDMFTLSYLRADQVFPDRGSAQCAYYDCEKRAVRQAPVRVQRDRGLPPFAFASDPYTPIHAFFCESHAATAERGRWPDETYRYLNYPIRGLLSVLLGAVIFLLMSVILHAMGRFPGVTRI